MASSGTRHPELAVVGLGYGAGDGLTLLGDRVLGESRWIGYFGLSPAFVQIVHGYSAAIRVDLDRYFRSDLDTYGFTRNLVHLALEATLAHRRAAIAVSGHPTFANAATQELLRTAGSAGVGIRLISAPSALDAYAARTGWDIVASGCTLLDARRLIERAHILDPHVTLMLWNAGYLAEPAWLHLASRLIGSWGADWHIHLYRSGGAGLGSDIQVYPLARPDAWGPATDFETTLIVPGKPAA
jgi:precorrin-6B methylase 1